MTITLTQVETILEGKISNNPNRFECANGVVFQINGNMNEDIENYFSDYGIEFHQLDEENFYCETVMSLGQFSNLKYIKNYKSIA